MDDRKYWPRTTEELAEDPIPRSLINQPLPPDNVIALPKTRSLYAMLCQTLIDTQALLARMEAGVQVQQQREVVRALYVASRNQAKALIAVLELRGLE